MLSKRFTTLNKNFLANYDWIDAAAGLGYVTYYANYGDTWSILAREPLTSQVPNFQVTCDNSGNYIEMSDKDWDLEFIIPAIIGGGYLYCSIPAEVTSGWAKNWIKADIVVYKWNGATETSLATGAGTAVIIGSGIGGSGRLITRALMPVTKFKKGEFLRVNVKLYGKINGAGGTAIWRIWTTGDSRGTTVYYQIDPVTDTVVYSWKNTTDMQVIVPHRLFL